VRVKESAELNRNEMRGIEAAASFCSFLLYNEQDPHIEKLMCAERDLVSMVFRITKPKHHGNKVSMYQGEKTHAIFTSDAAGIGSISGH